MRGTTKDAEERMEEATAFGGAVRYVFEFVSVFVFVFEFEFECLLAPLYERCSSSNSSL